MPPRSRICTGWSPTPACPRLGRECTSSAGARRSAMTPGRGSSLPQRPVAATPLSASTPIPPVECLCSSPEMPPRSRICTDWSPTPACSRLGRECTSSAGGAAAGSSTDRDGKSSPVPAVLLPLPSRHPVRSHLERSEVSAARRLQPPLSAEGVQRLQLSLSCPAEVRGRIQRLQQSTSPRQNCTCPSRSIPTTGTLHMDPSLQVLIEVSELIMKFTANVTLVNWLKTIRQKTRVSFIVAHAILHFLASCRAVGFATLLLFRSPLVFFKPAGELRKEDFLSSFFVLIVNRALSRQLSRVGHRYCLQAIAILYHLVCVCCYHFGYSILVWSYCIAIASSMLGELEVVHKVVVVATDVQVQHSHLFRKADNLVDIFKSIPFDFLPQQACSQELLLCRLTSFSSWIVGYIALSLCSFNFSTFIVLV